MKKIIFIMASCLVMMNASASLEEIFGNANTGDSCSSDYQCESLCCHNGEGVCGEHDPSAGEAKFCNKAPGESCLTSEFCKAVPVVVCKIYKTGLKMDGSVACSLRCPGQLIRGSCVNKSCRAPEQPSVPSFDPNDCSNAIDP